ncbi:Inorganic pyrophosphatase [compost metagenome]
MVYAADYGFLPQTHAGDGEPVDILVLMEEPTFTGCIVHARPIGMMKMDDSGEDFKVLSVPTYDKRWDHVTTLDGVPPHLLKELEHFFASYKTLDNSFPQVAGWFGAEAAKEYIEKCMEAYKVKYAGTSLVK